MTRLPALLLLILLAAFQGRQGGPRSYIIEGRFDIFTTDEMGNVYALRGDELELFDRQGNSWLRNSLKTFGRITTIDAFYSLKPMVFSPDQGQLAVLDNTLSVQGSVLNLPRNGYAQVVLACMSVQNAFWFFDEREMALIRVDPQLRPLANSGRLDQLLDFTPKPTMMQEHDSWLYVNDPREGILVFDLFGTYSRTIPIKGASNFEVRGQTIYYFEEMAIHTYDMRSFETHTFPLPPEVEGEVLNARVERGHLYLHKPDRIVVRPLPRTP
jgi:hypothetical protein